MAFDNLPLNDPSIWYGWTPWWNTQAPFMQQINLTLNSTQSLIFTTLIMILTTYVGSQCWKVILHFVKPGVRLNNEEFDDISQGDVLRSWLGIRPRQSYAQLLRDQALKRELGLAALITLAVFFGLGIILTFALSGFGAHALVRSRFSTACATSIDGGLQFRKAWTAIANYLEVCKLPENYKSSACTSSILSNALPKVEVKIIPCPFQPRACSGNDTSYSLAYNVSLAMLNLNIPSDSRVFMEHRILVSPLNAASFTYVRDKHIELSFYDPVQLSEGSYLRYWFTRYLWTLNGPNEYSDDFSGGISNADKFSHLPPMRLEMTPGMHLKSDKESFLYTHPLLKMQSATLFQLMLFSGLTNYNSTEPITDPLFRAIRSIPELGPSLYIPDHEATVIGGAEQYRFCIPTEYAARTVECSEWQSNRWSPSELEWDSSKGSAKEEDADPSLGIFSRFESEKFPSALQSEFRNNDAARRAFYTAFKSSSVEESMRESTQLPLVAKYAAVRMSPFVDPHNQTLLEFQTIMEIVALKVVFAMLYGVESQIPAQECGSILSSTANFTTYNVEALLVVLVVYAAIVWSSMVFDAFALWKTAWFKAIKRQIRATFQNFQHFLDDALQWMKWDLRELVYRLYNFLITACTSCR